MKDIRTQKNIRLTVISHALLAVGVLALFVYSVMKGAGG